MGEHRQRYSEDFKRETVKFVQEQQQKKTMKEIAEDLKISQSCLHEWMSKYREFDNEPVVMEERVRKLEEQLRDKERQLKEKEEELAIVKKAVHIFSRPKP